MQENTESGSAPIISHKLTFHDSLPYSKEQESLMTTATVTSKGQITIPANVRQSLNVETGDQVEFVQLELGQYLFVAANRSVTELKGMFGKPKNIVSIEEMNRVIASRGASAR